MKFKIINVVLLSLIINLPNVAMEVVSKTEREPLPLVYQSVLKSLRMRTKIPDNILSIIETDLKKAYETLKVPEELGLNQKEFGELLDTLLQLGPESFKAFVDLIESIKNNINLGFLKEKKEDKGFWDLQAVLREEILDVTPAVALKTIRGELIRSLIKLINNHAFKEKLTHKEFMDNYPLVDMLLWQPFDPDNKFYKLFNILLRKLKITDVDQWEEMEG